MPHRKRNLGDDVKFVRTFAYKFDVNSVERLALLHVVNSLEATLSVAERCVVRDQILQDELLAILGELRNEDSDC